MFHHHHRQPNTYSVEPTNSIVSMNFIPFFLAHRTEIFQNNPSKKKLLCNFSPYNQLFAITYTSTITSTGRWPLKRLMNENHSTTIADINQLASQKKLHTWSKKITVSIDWFRIWINPPFGCPIIGLAQIRKTATTPQLGTERRNFIRNTARSKSKSKLLQSVELIKRLGGAKQQQQNINERLLCVRVYVC